MYELGLTAAQYAALSSGTLRLMPAAAGAIRPTLVHASSGTIVAQVPLIPVAGLTLSGLLAWGVLVVGALALAGWLVADEEAADEKAEGERAPDAERRLLAEANDIVDAAYGEHAQLRPIKG